jgi:hypothetical protein
MRTILVALLILVGAGCSGGDSTCVDLPDSGVPRVASYQEVCWYGADGHPCVLGCVFIDGSTSLENNLPAVDYAGGALTCFADISPCAEMCH